MITTSKLKTYRAYKGDPTFARDSAMSDGDWRTIDTLLFGLWNVKAGQLSPEFAAETRLRLGEEAADADAALELWQMAQPAGKAGWEQPW